MDGELREIAQRALSTRPNFAYTLKEVQEDVQRVFNTGYFAKCQPHAEDTRDGVKLTIEASGRCFCVREQGCSCSTCQITCLVALT